MKPVTTEKAILLINIANTIVFEVDMKKNKNVIKKEVEDYFNIKIDSVNIHIRSNKKYAYIKLNPKYLAADLATKLGIM